MLETSVLPPTLHKRFDLKESLLFLTSEMSFTIKMKAWRRAAEAYNSKCVAIFRRIKTEFECEKTQEEIESIISEFGK